MTYRLQQTADIEVLEPEKYILHDHQCPITMSTSITDAGSQLYEEPRHYNVKEQFDIDKNECYQQIGKCQVPKNAISSPTTSKLSKLEKSLIILVVILALILVVSTALAAAAYSESIAVRNKLNII